MKAAVRGSRTLHAMSIEEHTAVGALADSKCA